MNISPEQVDGVAEQHVVTAAGRRRVVAEARAIVERAHGMIDVDVALLRGSYYHEHPVYCPGRRACAIGTLWLAAGVEPVPEYVRGVPSTRGFFFLPGTGNYGERAALLAERPALAVAYAALNAATRVYYDEHPELVAVNWCGDRVDMDALMGDAWDAELEALFEETNIDADGMRAVFAAAATTLQREEA